ncbi:MAG: TetR/AcrR family transcriptional regulator, partial [Terrimesophilobacter sp.]
MAHKTERQYSMTNRTMTAEATRNRILQATLELATEKLTVEIVLVDVAERAGVTVQTLLRHFGSRKRLFDAAVAAGADQIVSERGSPVGDIGEAVRVVVDHYESRGDWSIALLGQEASDERIKDVTGLGKQVHRDWVHTVFSPQLSEVTASARPGIEDLLAVATDVYTWKLLRRDRGLSRTEVEKRMRYL